MGILSNGSKFARMQTSIVNLPSGGGNKKAGMPYAIGRDTQTSIAFHQAGDGLLNYKNLQTNRFAMFPNQNLPIGMTGRGLISMR